MFDALGDGAMVLPAAPVQWSSRDTERRYAPDRELYYLTGLIDPRTVAVLVGRERKTMVFSPARDPQAELWGGPRLGPEEAGERAGADESHDIGSLDERLSAVLMDAPEVHFRLGRGTFIDDRVLDVLRTARARGARRGNGPRRVVDPGEVLDELRLIKDDEEIAAIRRACDVTVRGHRAGCAQVSGGVGEWTIQGAIDGTFTTEGGRAGFGTIVGGGERACILHYVRNDAPLPDRGVVLVDAGAEVGLYHGDATRTWPVGGRFTAEAAAVYDLVDSARRAAIEAVEPGASILEVHQAALHVLIDGLLELKVLQGSADEIMRSELYKPYFPHQTSHWLGLDVHDPGDYVRNGESRRLEAGMVLTVEPGLYFGTHGREGTLGPTAQRYAGIGVRLEDDVLVTPEGSEVMTAALPTRREDVEALARS